MGLEPRFASGGVVNSTVVRVAGTFDTYKNAVAQSRGRMP